VNHPSFDSLSNSDCFISVTEYRSRVSRFASDLQQCVWAPLPLLVLRIKEATNRKTLQVSSMWFLSA
jgi:hypothetical protein